MSSQCFIYFRINLDRYEVIVDCFIEHISKHFSDCLVKFGFFLIELASFGRK